MKEVVRDFTLIVGVPDDVNPENVEIVITNAEASYPTGQGAWVTIPYEDIDIDCEDPYEMPKEESDEKTPS